MRARPGEVDRDAVVRLVSQHGQRDIDPSRASTSTKLTLRARPARAPAGLPTPAAGHRSGRPRRSPPERRDGAERAFRCTADDPGRLLAQVQGIGDPQPFPPGIGVVSFVRAPRPGRREPAPSPMTWPRHPGEAADRAVLHHQALGSAPLPQMLPGRVPPGAAPPRRRGRPAGVCPDGLASGANMSGRWLASARCPWRSGFWIQASRKSIGPRRMRFDVLVAEGDGCT